jgi:acyl dehydratase
VPRLAIDHLDDLKDFVGREIATTDWFVMTGDRIRQFAEATEDRQWIHLDSERAKAESPYGSTIAHGFLTLSLLSYLMYQALEIRSGVSMAVNYGLNRVRFPTPVRANSRIRGKFTLQSLQDKGDACDAVFSVMVEVADEKKPCCVAEWVVRYYLSEAQ